MRYRVVFTKRFQSSGEESAIDPTAQLDAEVADGIVAEKVFVERLEPAAQHSQEELDEDDAFLALAAPEVWEYDVVDDRAREFEDAMRNSEVVRRFEIIDQSETLPGEATTVALSDAAIPIPTEQGWDADEPGRAGSGVSASAYEGPAAHPTVDPSAGGMAPGRPYFGNEDLEGIGEPSGGGIDDLTIVQSDDPNLGLTVPGEPGADWAANTGPAQPPGPGIATRGLADKSSTLHQQPGRKRRPRAKKPKTE